MCLVFPLAVSWLLASFCLVLRFPAASRDFRGVPRQLTSFATLLEVFRVCGGDGDGDDGDGINFGLVLHSFGFDFRPFWLHFGV